MSLTNEEIISRIKAMSSKKKKQDEIEEDSINNEIATINEYLEELDETQDDYLDIANKYSDFDYHNVDAIVSESRRLINKIKESLKDITSKNLFNKSINSNNVTINYYCQDPSQYPTPNFHKGSNVEVIYNNKE